MATTVQQYLSEHPVDKDDVVHVEDGGWVNPDGDFGSPQSLKWNYPLMPKNAQVRQRGTEREREGGERDGYGQYQIITLY